MSSQVIPAWLEIVRLGLFLVGMSIIPALLVLAVWLAYSDYKDQP